MKPVDRTKVCWSCEAGVGDEATYCPFCGTDLLTSSTQSGDKQSKQDKRFSEKSLEESLASLYKPPYSVRNRQGLGIPDEREEPAFKQASPPKENLLFQSYEQIPEKTPLSSEAQQGNEEVGPGGVWPLFLLSIGINLVVLGILIFFFSKEGVTRLEWDSRYWFLYLLIGLSITYLGVRSLKRFSRFMMLK